MQLGQIQEAIRDAVCAATGAPATQWGDTPQASGYVPAGRDGGHASLDLWVRSFGQPQYLDYVRSRHIVKTPPARSRNAHTLVGVREFTVECRIEVYDQTPGRDAMQLAARLRTRLRAEGPRKILRAASCGLLRIGSTIGRNYTGSDRGTVSVAITNLDFRAPESENDDTFAGGFIASLGINARYLFEPDGITHGPIQDRIEVRNV